jgi:hypothetical protein
LFSFSAQPTEEGACHVLQEAAAAAATGAPRAEGFELDLVGCACTWLAHAALLIGLPTGQLVLLNIDFEGSRAKRLKVLPCS